MENFRILNVTGKTKEIALAKANANVNINASKAYNKAGSPTDEVEFNEFVMDYIETHKKDMKNPGDAFYIVVDHAVENKKLRPYIINNNPVLEEVKYETEIHLLNKETGELLDVITGTKKEAEILEKKDTKEKEISIEVKRIKVPVKDEHKVWFTCDYVPSTGVKDGEYIVVVLD